MKTLAVLPFLLFLPACDADVLFHEDCKLEVATGVFDVFDEICLTQFALDEVIVQGDLGLINPLFAFKVPLPLFVGRTFSAAVNDGSTLIDPVRAGSGDFEVKRIQRVSNGRWRVDIESSIYADRCCFEGELHGLFSVDTLDEEGLIP
jgi:hypothetical protein